MGEADNDEALTILSSAIDNELEQARERAASLEQRAIAVITTSGVLVSLIFGFSALIKGREITHLPVAPKALLSIALISFVVAAFASLFTIKPRGYPVKSDWEKALREWIMSARDARTSIANLHLREIGHWQGTNDTKARYLASAIAVECIGIGFLAFSLLVIIL
jgi:hypothetical protein